MKVRFRVAALLLVAVAWKTAQCGGITPEQIFQPVVAWESLIGTWEVLPEENPLLEKGKGDQVKPKFRSLMTLRKDGTCRIFDEKHSNGTDGMWTLEDHEMFISLPEGIRVDFYVYGVNKEGFMVTRSPIKEGKDQLWSRVK